MSEVDEMNAWQEKAERNALPRRIQEERWIPAEEMIYDAMMEIESMPADVRLTAAVVLLQKAKDAVADYVDGVGANSPDAVDRRCPKCGQVPNGQHGEYPCPECGLPTTHDDPEPEIVASRFHVMLEISAECEAQDAKEGGAEYDDQYSPADWRRAIQGEIADMMPDDRMTTAITDLSNYRKRLVAIGALVVAALEALDRRTDIPKVKAATTETESDQGLTVPYALDAIRKLHAYIQQSGHAEECWGKDIMDWAINRLWMMDQNAK